MCGILGVFDFSNSRPARHIQQMATAIRHRGPDDEGYLLISPSQTRLARGNDTVSAFDGRPHISAMLDDAALGILAHRRLSILDLSPAGHNPLCNADGTLWITYNGEVYNYVEIRAELEELGFAFRSGTDTEVVLAAYEVWGVDCLARFNGMFAFAIWDTRQQQLFLARDRFGIKPFYYAQMNGQFAFASEIKALLAHPDVNRRASRRKIYDYLVNGSLQSERETFFEGVSQLPAGHAAILNADGQLRMWRYYQLDYSTALTEKDFEACAEAFANLLTDAVRLRLRSDVPVGSSLSGGLDSSSVVSIANRLLQEENAVHRSAIGERQKVFCAVYEGERFNEKPFMDAVIAQTGATATFTRPDSALLWQNLRDLVWHQDEPFASTAIFAQYCVMQSAREKGVTVLLDGQGADEILAGYPFYFGYYFAQLLRAGRINKLLGEVRGATRHSAVSPAMMAALTLWNISPAALRQIGWRMGGAKMLSNKPLPAHFIANDFATAFHQQAQMKHNPFPTLAQKLHEDVFATNLPVLLRYEDRNSMAFHLEARVPFLDHRVVEFAFQSAADAHIRDGWSKAMLRHAMDRQLPETIQWRRDKEGYTTPHQRWLRELAPQIQTVFEGDVRTREFISDEALTALRSHDVGSLQGLWRLLNLELWLQAFDVA